MEIGEQLDTNDYYFVLNLCLEFRFTLFVFRNYDCVSEIYKELLLIISVKDSQANEEFKY